VNSETQAFDSLSGFIDEPHKNETAVTKPMFQTVLLWSLTTYFSDQTTVNAAQ
jgi:hypothetical protein